MDWPQGTIPVKKVAVDAAMAVEQIGCLHDFIIASDSVEPLKGFSGNVLQKDYKGRDAIMVAAFYGRPKCLQWLMLNTAISTGARNKRDGGRTALMYACGAARDVSNVGGGCGGNNAGPQVFSCSPAFAECVRLLTDASCTTELLNYRSTHGMTALHYACCVGDSVVVDTLLLRSDLDTLAANDEGQHATDLTRDDNIIEKARACGYYARHHTQR
jgi:ankyrin repeat protein